MSRILTGLVRYRMYLRGFALFCALQGCGQSKSGTTTVVSGNPPIAGTCLNGPTSLAIRIFQENPFVSSGNPGLAFSANLTSAMTTPATLSGLTGNCTLYSSRYSLWSDGLFPNNVLLPTSSSQAYAPSDPEFQQLNSFYYATMLRDLVVDTLGATLSGQISIDAHCNQQDNAYFNPNSKRLCFGWHDAGSGKKVWAADDADVVIHEAGHTVNHSLASTSIMNSTVEAGAIDESIADYWALTMLEDSQLSEWFLGSMGVSYIRDATASFSYPASQNFEIHDDSRVLTQVLWDLRASANLGKTTTDKLVKRSLQLLPATTRFAEFYQAFYDASGPAFLNLSPAQRALIVNRFTARGIHRVDSAAGLQLSAGTQVYVIDDHSYTFQSGGNCNGVLDVGETALVLVNLKNPNGEMGAGLATLGAAPSGIVVPSGGEVGDFFRLKASSDFVSSLPLGGSNRDDAVLMASFVIRATSAGAKNFSLSFRPMYADPTGAVAQNPNASVNFALNVGSTATNSSCTNSALWP